MESPDTLTDLRNKMARASELEAQLQTVDKRSDERSSRIRMKLCEVLSDVLLMNPHFAMRKDCAGRLWRNCFYGRIGELRSRIAREKRKKGPSLNKLRENLKTFLNEAIVLYRWIVNKYESKLLPQLSQQSLDSEDSLPNSTAGVIPGLHRLLIHLGDLHRYAESYKESEKCYIEASKLAPGKGNPYNQLAVIAQLKETAGGMPQSCVSLYWYARSLLATKDPFETSKANLARLFESNREWLDKHGTKELPPPSAVSSKKAMLEQARAQKSAASQRFLAKFVDIHYDFFLAADKKETEETALVYKLQQQMDSFQSLVDATAFGDALLCKIVAINAFSMHIQNEDRSKTLATALFLRVGAILAQRVEKTLAKLVAASQQHASSSTSMPSVRLVVPLVLICDYLCTLADKDLLLEMDNGGKEATNYCRQTVLAFWSNICRVANLLHSLRKDLHPESLSFMRLTEYDNLVGFVPFKSFCSKANSDDVYVTADEAVKLLELYASSTQESVASTSSGNEEENRLKLLRFLQAVDSIVNRWEKGGSNSKGLLVRGESGVYKFTGGEKEDGPVDDEPNDPAMMDFANDDAQDTPAVVEKQALPKVPLFDGNRNEGGKADVVVYKQPVEGSGPALLVPGALLSSQTNDPLPETFAKNAEADMPSQPSAVSGEKRSGNQSSLSGSTPQQKKLVGGATGYVQQRSVVGPMDIVTEKKTKEASPPGLGPPPGFAGVSTGSAGEFLCESKTPAMAPPPPPGFSFAADSASHGMQATTPSYEGSSLSELRTSNPFASEYPMSSLASLSGSSSQGYGLFGSAFSQPPAPSHFLDVSRDEPSMLESSYITNLWLKELEESQKPGGKPLSTKNPFMK